MRFVFTFMVALMCVLSADAVSSQTPAPATTTPLYRLRILGVFDEQTGEPVAGAR